MIDAMKEVGESMHVSLRETGEGGVANTPEARKIKEKLGSVVWFAEKIVDNKRKMLYSFLK